MAEVTRSTVTGVTKVKLTNEVSDTAVYFKLDNVWYLVDATENHPVATDNQLDEIEETYDRLIAAREEVGRAIDKANRLEQKIKDWQ